MLTVSRGQSIILKIMLASTSIASSVRRAIWTRTAPRSSQSVRGEEERAKVVDIKLACESGKPRGTRDGPEVGLWMTGAIEEADRCL